MCKTKVWAGLVPSEAEGDPAPCPFLSFWWFSGNLWWSLAYRNITPNSAFILTWSMPTPLSLITFSTILFPNQGLRYWGLEIPPLLNMTWSYVYKMEQRWGDREGEGGEQGVRKSEQTDLCVDYYYIYPCKHFQKSSELLKNCAKPKTFR